MPTSDFLPTQDANLIPWTENFIAVANVNLVMLGLATTDITTLTTKKTDFATGLNTAIAKHAESKAATDAKNLKRSSLATQLRALARQIQAKPGVTDAVKIQLGLKPSSPIPAPTGPFTPTDLTYEIISETTILLKWNRNGNPQGMNFVIEASPLPDKDYKMIDFTTKAFLEVTYRDPSGKTYFRVRAKKGEEASEPSNSILIQK